MDLTPEEIRELNDRLDREWDVDRRLRLLVGGGVLVGLLLGRWNPRWRVLSVVMAGMALADALTGRSGLRALLRRVGARTRQEVERERYTTLFGQEPPEA